jgi:hypothetical protein
VPTANSRPLAEITVAAIARLIRSPIRAMPVPVVPAADDVRGAVDPYLLPHEQIVITVRKHPASPLRLFCLLTVAAAVAVLPTAGTLPANVIVVSIAWATCALLLLWSLVAAKIWYSTFLVATGERLLFIGGFDGGKVTVIPMAKIIHLTFQRPLIGRLIGYGAFNIKWSGQNRTSWKASYMPYPEQLYLEICGLIFPEKLNEIDIDQTGRFYPGVDKDNKRP